jgi:SMC interacting uncharacterized protein involved in chromosome segregation
LQTTLQHLTEQVEGQAYSKKDIERLKYERQHLRKVLQDLRADGEKAEQDVWELGMRESSRAEVIGRLVRQVNDFVESLEHALTKEAGSRAQDLLLHVDLGEPTDSLAALDFEELHFSAQASASAHAEAAHLEEGALHKILDEQRVIQEELSEKERERHRLQMRLEQLQRVREDYRLWSAEQLDDAQRTAEATEDSVHAVSIGSSAPSLRDAAEVDKLRLELSALRTQGESKKLRLQEQIRREEERFQDHRQHVIRELDAFVKVTEKLCGDLEAMVEEGPPTREAGVLRVARCGGS